MKIADIELVVLAVAMSKDKDCELLADDDDDFEMVPSSVKELPDGLSDADTVVDDEMLPEQLLATEFESLAEVETVLQDEAEGVGGGVTEFDNVADATVETVPEDEAEGVGGGVTVAVIEAEGVGVIDTEFDTELDTDFDAVDDASARITAQTESTKPIVKNLARKTYHTQKQ